jgi:hypothetical protein
VENSVSSMSKKIASRDLVTAGRETDGRRRPAAGPERAGV